MVPSFSKLWGLSVYFYDGTLLDKKAITQKVMAQKYSVNLDTNGKIFR